MIRFETERNQKDLITRLTVTVNDDDGEKKHIYDCLDADNDLTVQLEGLLRQERETERAAIKKQYHLKCY